MHTFLFAAAQPQDSLKMEVVEKIRTLSAMSPAELLHTVGEDLIQFALKILAAIALYLIGIWLIRRIRNLLRSLFARKKVEPTLATFLLSATNISLTVLLVVIVVGVLGVNTSSLAALLAAGGVAIGMALSGTLQNFAGGIMILFFKPFKVGDFIDANGYTGTVQSINITATRMTTGDNKLVVIPNGALSNGNILNYSATGIRRVEWKISIEYGDDVDVAKKVLLEMLAGDSRVLSEPAAPTVVLDALADSAIIVMGRAWTRVEDFWSLYWEINEKIYKQFPEAGLHFPYPKLDVNLTKGA